MSKHNAIHLLVSQTMLERCFRSIFLLSLRNERCETPRSVVNHGLELLLAADRRDIFLLFGPQPKHWYRGEMSIYLALSPEEMQVLNHAKRTLATIIDRNVTIGEVASAAIFLANRDGGALPVIED